jgi:methionyl-tRNA formyltransferase
MGTPEFAVPALDAIGRAGHDIVMVVTQPDRPKGRGHKLSQSQVKVFASGRGLPVAQPQRVSDPEFIDSLRALAPDVAVVAAFGQKIPNELLSVPAHGFINIHASCLPRLRGAAPIQRAIMNGDAETGVTIMYMDEGWDTGDIGIMQRVPIPPDATAEGLSAALATCGGKLIVEFLRLLEEGDAPRTPQHEAAATYAPKVRPEETVIDWNRPGREIVNLVRALYPDPGARTTLDGKGVRVLRASVPVPGEISSDGGPPGEIVAGARGELLVRVPDGLVSLDLVQPESRKQMTGSEFIRGRRPQPGSRFA